VIEAVRIQLVLLSLIDYGKGATSGSFSFHQTERLEHSSVHGGAGLQKSVISSGNMVYSRELMARPSDPPTIIEFGHFSILPHRRQLLAEGRQIKLGGRAFDLLLALLEAPGAVVGKDELLRRIWPGRIVEEHRLQG